MKGIIMKIKTVIRVSAFIAMPFINADIDSDRSACKSYLSNRFCLANDRIAVAIANFDHLYSISNEDLKEMKPNYPTDIQFVIDWILKNRQTSAVQTVSTQETNANPSLVDLLMSLQENYSLQGNEAFEKILDLAIKQEMKALRMALEDFIKTWGLQEESNFKKAYEIVLSFFADQAEVSSSAPAPVEVPVQPTNPYLGKTPDELLALSDADPSLNDNPLFNEALSRALGGEETSDIGSLSETFPLKSVIQRGCDFDELKSSLEVLSLDYSTKDQYSIPVLNDFLQKNGLTAITTPGFGNCAFDAVLLTWFCREGLYNPQWNITLGTYLEDQIAGFRGEIANLLPEGKKLGEETRDTIRVKNQYVSDAVFTLIAQHLKTEIIVIATEGTAQCCLGNGEISASITPDETNQLIKSHPDALIVCHNGTNHFLATRPLLPEEHQE